MFRITIRQRIIFIHRILHRRYVRVLDQLIHATRNSPTYPVYCVILADAPYRGAKLWQLRKRWGPLQPVSCHLSQTPLEITIQQLQQLSKFATLRIQSWLCCGVSIEASTSHRCCNVADTRPGRRGIKHRGICFYMAMTETIPVVLNPSQIPCGARMPCSSL